MYVDEGMVNFLSFWEQLLLELSLYSEKFYFIKTTVRSKPTNRLSFKYREMLIDWLAILPIHLQARTDKTIIIIDTPYIQLQCLLHPPMMYFLPGNPATVT